MSNKIQFNAPVVPFESTDAEAQRALLDVPGLNQDGNIEGIVIHRSGTFDEINDIVLEDGEIAVVIETGEIAEFRVGDGVTSGGLVYSVSTILGANDSYIVAVPGDDLAAKYNESKALTPNGSALSDTNRATLFIMKGSYALSGTWNIDTNYVDIVGIGTTEKNPSVVVNDEINVTAWNVRINGIETPNKFGVTARPDITSGVTGTASNNRIQVTGDGFKDGDVISFNNLNGGTGLSNNVRYVVAITSGASSTDFRLRNETTGALITFSSDITSAIIRIWYNSVQSLTNCTGGSESFASGGNARASGTFTNCTGGNRSFGGLGGIASGTFANCTGGNGSFGGGTASGTFTNCTGGESSFGGSGIASGTFTNCTGGDYSFGAFGTASGTFTNCTGGDFAFGGRGIGATGVFDNCTGGDYSFGGSDSNGYGDATGTFNNCTGGYGSFGGGIGADASGTFTYCTGGDHSFGAFGTASGTFTNCTGGHCSFGGSYSDGPDGTASGTFNYCTGGHYSFGGYGGTALGTFNNCTGGDGSFGGYFGEASGTFTNCTGGNSSFGGYFAVASGTFNNCTGGHTSFGSLGTASGTFNYCTGVNRSFGGWNGSASGTFKNCIGGDRSFGGDGGTLSGKLYYCRLTTGSFQTPTGSGLIRLSIDGSNNIVDEDPE